MHVHLRHREYVQLAKADDALHATREGGHLADRTGRAKGAHDAVENTTKTLDRLIDWASPPYAGESPR